MGARIVNESKIARLLVERGQELFRGPRAPIKFTGIPAADNLLDDLDGHPHAFVFGCVMDRQMKAERAWLIPYRFAQKLGDFGFDTLRELSLEQVHNLMTRPEPLHRFTQGMSRNFYEAISRIAEEYDGDASRIWSGQPSSAEVVYRFLQFRGAGPKIATMAANILARDFKIPMADYYSIDISADVHIRRVLYRLGLIEKKATVEVTVYRARALHPEFPGLLDFPAWEIGRTWCKPKAPLCGECYMRELCPVGQGRATR